MHRGGHHRRHSDDDLNAHPIPRHDKSNDG